MILFGRIFTPPTRTYGGRGCNRHQSRENLPLIEPELINDSSCLAWPVKVSLMFV